MNQQDSFMQQMIESMDKNNREKKLLEAQKAQLEADLNAHRYSSIRRFPIQGVRPGPYDYTFNNPAFQNIRNSLWLNYEQKQRDEQERQRRKAIGCKIVTESIGIVLRSSKYKKLSSIYDMLSAVMADNLLDAVTKEALAINTLIDLIQDGEKNSDSQGQKYDVSCHETDLEQ